MLALKDHALLRRACYIDGAWVAADSGETMDVTNPVTGVVIATVPYCGAADFDAAGAIVSKSAPSNIVLKKGFFNMDASFNQPSAPHS